MGEPRWLSEVEQDAWRAFVETSARVHLAVETELKEKSGLSFADYEVLVNLSEAEGHRLRMSELSEQTVHSQSRLSQRINRLVRRGWVLREPCPDDRRGTYATLTDAGFRVIEEAAPAHLEAVRAYFVDLIPPGNVEDLGSVCEKINGPLREISPQDTARDLARRHRERSRPKTPQRTSASARPFPKLFRRPRCG